MFDPLGDGDIPSSGALPLRFEATRTNEKTDFIKGGSLCRKCFCIFAGIFPSYVLTLVVSIHTSELPRKFMSDNKISLPEPWLRGTLGEVPPVARGVLHALELAREDLHKWCAGLNSEQIHLQPAGLPSVAVQL